MTRRITGIRRSTLCMALVLFCTSTSRHCRCDCRCRRRCLKRPEPGNTSPCLLILQKKTQNVTSCDEVMEVEFTCCHSSGNIQTAKSLQVEDTQRTARLSTGRATFKVSQSGIWCDKKRVHMNMAVELAINCLPRRIVMMIDRIRNTTAV